jgi:hypothetical protein
LDIFRPVLTPHTQTHVHTIDGFFAAVVCRRHVLPIINITGPHRGLYFVSPPPSTNLPCPPWLTPPSGLTFQAGAGAFFLYVQGQGKKIFRDGLRLALTTFIASAALWSQIAFSATLVDPTSSLGCQVAVIFSSFFDQLARFTLEQYLLWAINSGLKKAPDTFVPQGILMIRLVVGGIFVGFQRPQVFPVCQTSSGMFAIGIAVAATDLIMILIFLVRAVMIGLLQDVREKRPGMQRSKAILFLIAGLALWTGASVPLFLGIQSIDTIWRTALPAGTLSLVLGLVAAFKGDLVMTRERASIGPNGPSMAPGFDNSNSRDLQSRDISTAESNYPPSRFEDLKGDEATTIMAYPTGQQIRAPAQTLAVNMATVSSGYAAAPGAATIGVAVGRPSMDGRGLPPAQGPYSRDNSKLQPKAKGGMFNRAGPATGITVGKLAISNPILQRQTEEGPLNKIATIDLATAARMDRERRDLANLTDSQSLIAQRAAPLPPAMTHEEVLRREQSFKRKQVSRTSTELLGPPRPLDMEESRPTNGTAAFNTSLQPSPGADTVRRRSPRSSPRQPSPPSPPTEATNMARDAALAQIERAASIRTTTTQSSAATAVEPLLNNGSPALPANMAPKQIEDPMEPARPALPPTWPKQKSVRNTIRPSRTQTSRSPETSQEGSASRLSPETTLQRRGTVGLPSNPRSRAVKTPGQEITGRQPTVMFMKGIQYNDPVAVQNIMQDASAKTPKAPAPQTGNDSRESVLHRPRPIPRQVEKDRQIFPAEQSPVGHKRTRSGGSMVSRLRDQPASPPNLPPLPPAPKSAGYPTRPQPNDTRSMTFDEKMDLFFPGPKSAGAVQGAVPIPEMPALPSAYALERNQSTTRSRPSDFLRNSSRGSESSAKTSIRTQSILEIAQSPERPPMPNTSKFSIDTYMTTTEKQASDEAKSSWMPELVSNIRVRSQQSNDGAKRRSSSVLPLNDGTISEFSEARTRIDDETATNWGSVHSPVVMEARQVPVVPAVNPKYIQQQNEPETRDLLPMPDFESGRELMTIMLDPAVERERKMAPKVAPQIQEHWHHRVGDECATFSARKQQVVSRRMPPPTPLLLNLPPKNQIIIAAEPSPLESPQEALLAIQDQLKKFEEPVEGSDDDQEERLRLLESLEQEMGQQEDQWHEMQIGIQRDSLSTVETLSRRVSHQDVMSPGSSLKPQSQRTSFAAHREARRASRLQVPSRNADTASTESALSPARRRRSLWQRKLAEVELDYSNSDFLAPMPSVKLMSVTMSQLGSPTPPDTDSDNEEILRAREVLHRQNAPVAKLWVPGQSVLPAAAQGRLWTPPARSLPVAPEDIPGLLIRPAVRKISAPLAIVSTHLWKNTETFKRRSYAATMGLWRGAALPEAPKPRPRPVTQRPPRRNKRVSNLADIIENPEPLPNKRGTLGIFQFPWGEMSENPTVQVRPNNMFMAMPGTMSTGGSSVRAALEARSMQLMSEEQSSSFFEDYDEEEDDDDAYISEINEEDSDGEFDETTLWEIASLLRSNQVPSKYSLLPQPLGEDDNEASFETEPVFEASDYEMEDDADFEMIEEVQDRPVINRQDSDLLSFEMQAPKVEAPPASASATVNTTWVAPVKVVDDETTGLFNPSEKRSNYRSTPASPAAIDVIRKPRTTREPLKPVGNFSGMWTQQAAPVSRSNALWSAPSIPEDAAAQPTPEVTAYLWGPKLDTVVHSQRAGLFIPGQPRELTPTAPPAALDTIRRPRVANDSLPRLESTALWTTGIAVSHDHDWISMGSISSGSSSDVSAPSSGSTTPVSESAPTLPSHNMEASNKAPSDTIFPGPASPAWWNAEKVISLPEPEVIPQDESSTPLSSSFISSQRRLPVFTDAEWDTALQSAIVAGTRLHRLATAEDWDAALEEVIDASRQQLQPAPSPVNHDIIFLPDMEPESFVSESPVVKSPVPKSSSATLWVQSHVPQDTRASLWAPKSTLAAPSFSSTTLNDPAIHRKRSRTSIPQSRKAEIRAQIAAIEAGLDPSIVGLVDFQGQSLWAPNGGVSRRPLTTLGGNRNWIAAGQQLQQQAPPVRASQAVFTFWLPRSGDT